MIRVLLLFITVFACSSFIQKEKQDDESLRIYWKADQKLVWEDFQGKPVSSDPNKAYTFYQTTMGSNFVGNDVQMIIKVYFEKNKSWVKQDSKTDKLLKHEQLHFDIGELYTRKLRKKIKDSKFTLKNLSSECSKLFKEVEQKGHDAQKQYDAETKHSTIESAQTEWEKKIEKELKSMDAYVDDVVVVKVGK
jgi:hypothetical protein